MKLRSVLNNRKAQEMSISTIVILALAVIVLVVVVLGFSKGWNYIFDKIGVLPSGLEAAAQSCQVSADAELKTSYCNDFKEVRIAGLKQYMNCEKLQQGGYITIEKPSFTCGENVNSLAGELCENNKLKEDVKVNGVSCFDHVPEFYIRA